MKRQGSIGRQYLQIIYTGLGANMQRTLKTQPEEKNQFF
jgi:hypothetical protein